MARVMLNAYATLRAYLEGAGSIEAEIEPGKTVSDLLRQVGIPPEQTRIVFVNNRAGSLSTPLYGDEKIGVFPAIGGG